jgi:CHAT domain-containing protein
MDALRHVGISAAIFLFVVAVSPSQAQTLKDVLSSSEKLMQRGDVKKAETILAREYQRFKRRGEIESALMLRLNLGGLKYQRGALNEALEIFKEVYVARKGLLGNNHDHTRMVLQNIVQTLLDLRRDFDAAGELNRYSLQANLDADDIAWAIEWIREIKGSYEQKSDFQNALKLSGLLLENLNQRGVSKSDREYLSIVANRSAILAADGRINEASTVVETALAEATPSKDNIDPLVQLRSNRALVLDHHGRTAHATAEVLTALVALDDVGASMSPQAATLHMTLARLYHKQQYLSVAKAAVEKSLEIYNADKDLSVLKNRSYLQAFAVLGDIYASLGEKEQAFGALAFASKQSCDVFGNYDPDCISIGLDVARAYVRFGLWDYAERSLSAALARLNATKSPATNHWISVYAGACETLLQKDKPRALDFCKRAYDLAGPSRIDGIGLNAAAQLARMHLDAGHVVQAVEIGAASLRRAMDDDTARRSQEFSRLLSATLSALSRLGYSADRRQLFDIALRAAALTRSSPGEDLLDRIRQAKGAPDPQQRRTLLRREHLRGQLDRLQARQVSMQVSSEEFQTGKRALKGSLNSEIARLKGILAAGGQHEDHTDQPGGKQVLPFGLDQLQSSLREGETCVIYYAADQLLFAWVADRDGLSLSEFSIGKKELDALVSGVRPPPGTLAKPSETNPWRGFKAEAAYALFGKLWQPLEPRLNGKHIVYVVPDGPLLQLPFPAMLTEPPEPLAQIGDLRKLPWLVLRPYAISVFPHMDDIVRRAHAGGQANARYLGIGAPDWAECGPSASGQLTWDAVTDAVDPAHLCILTRLSSAKSELDEVQKALKTVGAVITGQDASEDTIRRLDQSGELGAATLIVFSAHGLAASELDFFKEPARLGARNNIGIPLVGDAVTQYMRDSLPNISEQQLKELDGALLYMWYNREVPDTRFVASAGLILSSSPSYVASDATNDGFLSAPEIAILDLQADLVILSACNTAENNGLGGAEVFLGLSEAFLAAGAKSLIVSQWIVAEDAAKQMTLSVVNLLHTDTASDGATALQHAQRNLVNAGPDPHPFYWAPFAFVGSAISPRLHP